MACYIIILDFCLSGLLQSGGPVANRVRVLRWHTQFSSGTVHGRSTHDKIWAWSR